MSTKGKYVASIDQGTSSSRFMVFDKTGKVVFSHQREHKQYFPSPGMVEHDPEEIWECVKACVNACPERLDKEATCDDIAALGITNQRETTVVWNRHTGKPYHNAIVWSDNRTGGICDSLNKDNLGPLFTSKTGLPISPYFSGTKLMYLLDTVPNLRQAAECGDAIFGTIDTWLVWKLTAGAAHVTDVTNASRTLMMNLQTCQWDLELTAALKNIPVKMLPEIRSSSERFGKVAPEGALGGIGGSVLKNVEIGGILGDQQAALFGQSCFGVGETKVTYGTGAFLMMNTGKGVKSIIPSQHGLLTTVAYQLGRDAEPHYALEGSVAMCGSLIQWLRDNLQTIDNAQQSESVASTVADNGGVYFVPAFSGLFAPYWRSDARGVITGLTAYNTRAHIVRAALEASAFQVNEIIDAMIADSQSLIPSLKVDGGMTSNSMVMQFQANLLNMPLVRPIMAETTALGSANAAGLAVGFFQNEEELRACYTADRAWRSDMDSGVRHALLRNWRKAVARSLNLNEPVDGKGPVVEANNALIAQLSPEGKIESTSEISSSLGGSYWQGIAHASFAIVAVAGIVQFLTQRKR
jgi:glycerol kinase